MKVCFNIGHGRNANGIFDFGTQSKDFNIKEFDFNKDVAENYLRPMNWPSDIQVNFVYQQSWEGLPKQLNELKPDFILSMHCNGAAGEATPGSEVLYAEGSVKGLQAAKIALSELEKVFGKSGRSTPLLSRTLNDRGGGLLIHTAAPIIICEPFFMTNNKSMGFALKNKQKLAQAYFNTVIKFNEYLKSIK